MFRHPIRRLIRQARRFTHPERRVPRELVLANEMMESGNYATAAEQFEVIARLDETRGGRTAPQLFLRAGRARVLSGHTQAGLAQLKHGLSLLANRGNWLRLYRAGRRITAELTQLGLTDEASEISASLNGSLPAGFSTLNENQAARKPVLPTHCPSCGAALPPDEVDWLDEITAECAYCGSPVHEES